MVLLIYMLQTPQTRLSWVVIVAAALVLAGGISLLVYFYRRYKRIEKETEADWESVRGSLFAGVPAERKTEVAGDEIAAETHVEADATSAQGLTREFASPTGSEPAEVVSPEMVVPPASPAPEVRSAEGRATEVLASPSQTELLASPSPAAPAFERSAPEAEPEVFDEEVWLGLEAVEQPPVAPEQPAGDGPSRGARVASPSPVEPFEPLRIESAGAREPFEPPLIEPIAPIDQAGTRALHSMSPPAAEASPETAKRQTGLLGSSGSPLAAAPDEPARRADGETLELAAAFAVKDSQPPIATNPAYKSRLAPAGSILGLPFEASNQPLILGTPVRPAEETGIGALTNYGKDLGPKGGRAGTVALVLVLALLAGAAGVYYFVPSAHARINSLVARIRGVDGQNLEAGSKPKAQVIPSFRPEVNKNMVIARGAVDNISDEPLESLEIEVSLQRGADAPPEIRRIPVTPSPVPPGERGNFEFEYDGKRDTGFAGYKITRLLSNGSEVKFKSPAQK